MRLAIQKPNHLASGVC